MEYHADDEFEVAAENDIGEFADAAVSDDADDDDVGPAGAGGVLLRYWGGPALPGLPTRAALAAARPGPARALAGAVARALAAGGPLAFMPTDVEDINVYERGRPAYALRVYGALADGTKAEVTVGGLEVFFDVRVPAGEAPSAFDATLRRALRRAGADEGGREGGFSPAELDDVRTTGVMRFPARGYHVAPVAWRRVTTPTVQLRKRALALATAAGFETASDDRTAYYRKAAREHKLPLAGWATLSSYEYEAGPTLRSPLCAHVFRVTRDGYRPAGADAPPAAGADPTFLVGWDIETHSGRGTGDVPTAAHEADVAFMVCLAAAWESDGAPAARVVLTAVETAPDPRWTTVVCDTPDHLLRAFALAWRALAPDVVVGFNDGGYDWPFVVTRAHAHGVLGDMWDAMTAAPRRGARSGDQSDDVLKWHYQADRHIKIAAGDSYVCSYLKVPGVVPLDVRACYKKLYPRDPSSLKAYLAAVGLPGKADMPVPRMWRLYVAARDAPDDPAAAEGMRRVAHYCDTDAARCLDLLAARHVVAELREVAALAYVSFGDAHYYAGGMKVCNLLGAYAADRGMVASMAGRERADVGKYPGGYVYPPEKGVSPDPAAAAAVDAAARADAPDALAAALEAFAGSRPVTGLDFASLYPSLIRAYNLSPDRMVLDADEAAALRARGCVLHDIAFTYGARDVRAWSVRASSADAVLGSREEMGLYAMVLDDLFERRRGVKAELAGHTAFLELAASAAAAARSGGRYADALRRSADDPRFARLADAFASCGAQSALDDQLEAAAAAAVAAARVASVGLNSKQSALKVYMNTFYGVAGDSSSAFFLLELAGGVTAAGQYNIKAVADFVTAQKFRIKYGDSVAGDTPLVVRVGRSGQSDGTIAVVAVADLAAWLAAHPGRAGGRAPRWAPHRVDTSGARAAVAAAKESFAPESLEVWSDTGFTAVRRVIRHRYAGALWRVATGRGTVDCTADHSLVRATGAEVAPRDLVLGTPLLHADDAGLVAALDRAGAAAAGAASTDVSAAFLLGLKVRGLRRLGWRDDHTGDTPWGISGPPGDVAAAAAAARIMGLHWITQLGDGTFDAAAWPDRPEARHAAGAAWGADCDPAADRIAALLTAPRVLADAFFIGLTFGKSALAMLGHDDTTTVHTMRRKDVATVVALLARRCGFGVVVRARADTGAVGPWVADVTIGPNAQAAAAQAAATQAAATQAANAQAAAAQVATGSGVVSAAWAAAPPGGVDVYDLETSSHHFHVGPGDLVVHNTDSLYLVCPNHHFAACDAEYAAALRVAVTDAAAAARAREAWWGEMVRVTMRVIKDARAAVNDFLRRDNGTNFLSMSYEEVLYPVVFTGKKKYFGVPHLSVVNFLQDLFVRGIDVVKQGQSGLAVDIGWRVMRACVALDNTRSVRAIVEDVIRDALANPAQWDFRHFVKTAAWRPDKKNAAVQRFVARMRARAAAAAPADAARLYALPEPGERFNFVMTRPAAVFDLAGRRTPASAGDRMEYAHVARELGLEVDVSHYMMTYVVSLCARFANGDPAFHPPPDLARALGDAADKYAFDRAGAALKALIRQLSAGGETPAALAARGRAYRVAYRAAAGEARAALVARVGADAAAVLAGDACADLAAADGAAAAAAAWASAGAHAAAAAAPGAAGYACALDRALGVDQDAATLYAVAARLGAPGRTRRADPVATAVASCLDRLEADARAALAATAAAASDVAARYTADLEVAVLARRPAPPPDAADADADAAPPADADAADAADAPVARMLGSLSEADRAPLIAYRRAWLAAAAVQFVRLRAAEYRAHLAAAKNRRLGVATLTPAARAAAVAAGAARPSPNSSGDIVVPI